MDNCCRTYVNGIIRGIFPETSGICLAYASSAPVTGTSVVDGFTIGGVYYAVNSNQIKGGIFYPQVENQISNEIVVATGSAPSQVQLFTEADGTDYYLNIYVSNSPAIIESFTVDGITTAASQQACPLTANCPVSIVIPIGIDDDTSAGVGNYLSIDSSRYRYWNGTTFGPYIDIPDRIANYYHTGTEGPHFFDIKVLDWEPFILLIPDSFIAPTLHYEAAIPDNATALFQYSIDGGLNWSDGDTHTAIELGIGVDQSGLPDYFVFRLVITTEHGCEYISAVNKDYMGEVHYAVIVDPILNAFNGWTINGNPFDYANLRAATQALSTININNVGFGVIDPSTCLVWYFGNTTAAPFDVVDGFAAPVTVDWKTHEPMFYQTTSFTVDDASQCSGFTSDLPESFVADIQTAGIFFNDPLYSNNLWMVYRSFLNDFMDLEYTQTGNDITVTLINHYMPVIDLNWVNFVSTGMGGTGIYLPAP